MIVTITIKFGFPAFFFVPLCRKSLVNNERFHTCCYFAWSLLHRIAPVRSCLISNIWSTFIYDCWFCAYFLSITFFAHSVLLDVVFPGPAVTCPSEVAHLTFIPSVLLPTSWRRPSHAPPSKVNSVHAG